MKTTTFILLTLPLLLVSAAHAQAADGAKIYAAQCASCHGDKGQGVSDAYDEPLAGDATVAELTKLIAETMPEGEAELCEGKDAAAVAKYVHQAFYSPAARAKLLPKVRLARLTGLQLRRSLEDLRMRLEGWAPNPKGEGLKASYYASARPRRDRRKIERVDRSINFDFGREGPGEGIKPEDFSIEWSGLLRARETGKHELIINSTCAFIFYLGGSDREFINNHVQSGDKTEFRRTVTLTAGRVYPLRLRFYQRKRKTEQPPAKVSLSWRPPHREAEIIPPECLIPGDSPPTFAVQAKLPPDDRSYGYARGIAVNRQWDESTTTAALEFAQAAIDEMWPRFRRSKGRKIPQGERKQLRAFLQEIVETAFREPLTDEIRKAYIDSQLAKTDDDAEAVKRVVLLTLKSPRFLYPTLDQHRSDSERAANRLALTLFDSLPSDEWLIRAGREGRLKKDTEIRQAAQRMVRDYRTRGKVREFIHEWLDVDSAKEIAKAPEHFPDFDRELTFHLQDSFNSFIDSIVWSEESDYQQLFLADWTFTSPRLESYYGDAWKPSKPQEAEGQKEERSGDAKSDADAKEESKADESKSEEAKSDDEVDARPQAGLVRSVGDARRQGLLTHPYLLSRLAYQDSTSPIHRGVFLLRHVLGRTLRPPNEAFTPLSPDLHPDLTTRERVQLQTSPKTCQACHVKINSLGFTLESFDAVGRYREIERKRKIDTSGSYSTRKGEQVKFDGPESLAQFLAGSDDAHTAFVDRAFQHFVKQPPAAFGPETLNRLTAEFKKNGHNIQKLLVEIAVVAAREPRPEPTAAVQPAASN